MEIVLNSLNRFIDSLETYSDDQKNDLKAFFESFLATMESCKSARYIRSVPDKYHLEYLKQHRDSLVRNTGTLISNLSWVSIEHTRPMLELFEKAVKEKEVEYQKQDE